MVVEKSSFVTEDGYSFDTYAEARMHEKVVGLRKLLEEGYTPVYGSGQPTDLYMRSAVNLIHNIMKDPEGFINGVSNL